MAIITLCSASGSPGVTTTALGLALSWTRPVILVEADPTGGSGLLAGYLRGTTTPPDSLIDLALAHREGTLEAAVPQVMMPLPGTSVMLIPGTRSHEQARSLVALWQPLTEVLRGLERTGQDVIVDAGRLGLMGFPEPLMFGSDLTLLLTRSDLVSLSGAHSWAASLREDFAGVGVASSLGVAMVGQGDPYGPREVARVLEVPVVATLAWEPGIAEVLSRGSDPPRPGVLHRLAGRSQVEESGLWRSLRAARTAIEDTITGNRARLDPGPIRRRQG